MATTWPQLRTFIQGSYNVRADGESWLGIWFPLADGRHQSVYVTHLDFSSAGEWISLQCPFAVYDPGRAGAVLEAAKPLPNFGIGLFPLGERDAFALRYAMPLADLQLDEFVSPLRSLASAADALERSLDPTGADTF